MEPNPEEGEFLTTVRQPFTEIGRFAVRTLMQRSEEPNLPTVQALFSTQLIVRSSVRVLDEARVPSKPPSVQALWNSRIVLKKETLIMPFQTESIRPKYHYTPRRNFMNDPNGLVFFDGRFLMFHQYHPEGNEWGHVSWKQAESADLVNWTHLPVAIAEEDGVMAFSGSAFADESNSGGFGKDASPVLVAMYTGHRSADEMESPCLAYSLDQGTTWSKYKENPVLPWEKDFRDPKVFRHEGTARWIMVIVKASEKRAVFFSSLNLKDWELLSSFGPEGAAADSIANWECPDIFPLPIEGSPGQFRWVLHIGVGEGHPNGGSGGQYFVGEFDGKRFINDNPCDLTLWSDYGKDNYAAISWSGAEGPLNEKYWVGWMSNWQYAEKVPTSPWRNGLTLPRLLSLRRTEKGLRLIQRPIPALKTLRSSPTVHTSITIPDSEFVDLEMNAGVALEIEAEFDAGDATEFGLAVRVGENERTFIGVDRTKGEIYVDRSRSGEGVSFSKSFLGRHSAPATNLSGKVRLHVFVDSGSVEVFAMDGEVVLTELIFPKPESGGLCAYSIGGQAVLTRLAMWKLKSAKATYCENEETDGESE